MHQVAQPRRPDAAQPAGVREEAEAGRGRGPGLPAPRGPSGLPPRPAPQRARRNHATPIEASQCSGLPGAGRDARRAPVPKPGSGGGSGGRPAGARIAPHPGGSGVVAAADRGASPAWATSVNFPPSRVAPRRTRLKGPGCTPPLALCSPSRRLPTTPSPAVPATVPGLSRGATSASWRPAARTPRDQAPPAAPGPSPGTSAAGS